MRITLAALVTAVLATVLTGIIGVAAAEAPTATPVRAISVEGVASAPIEQNASLAQADAAYRQAMGAALADGKGKAEFLASSAGATLGAVQTIVEDGGYVQCTSGAVSSEGETTGFVQYEGEQPDFGNGQSARGVVPLAAASRPAPVPTVKKHKKKKKKHASGKAAAAGSCKVYATVGLGYLLS